MQNTYKTDLVFVFGSNLAGRHGKGAAQAARAKWGAVYGVGVGPQGNSYAIPTKDANLKTLELGVIETYIKDFIEYAWNTPDKTFLLTPIGCGLAGHKVKDVLGIFKKIGLPYNVVLTSSWVNDHL
jgi:hypothetical protein